MKRRETDPASNQFPKCSPPSGTHRNSQSWVEQRGVGEETQATWWRKRRVQRGESSQSSNLAPQRKMGTEDWVLKGTKLITNTKKQKLKIQSGVWNFKNTMLKEEEKEREKKNKVTKIVKKIQAQN